MWVKVEGVIDLSFYVLKPFSFMISGPKIVFLLGENGSGKTTLLNLMSGDVSLRTVFVSWGETPRISYLRQVSKPIDRSVLDVVPPAYQDLLDELGIPPDASLPSLSYGQLRMVDLIRTVSSDWNVLLLDEPFQSIDPKHRGVLKQIVHSEFSRRIEEGAVAFIVERYDVFESLREFPHEYLVFSPLRDVRGIEEEASASFYTLSHERETMVVKAIDKALISSRGAVE